MRNYGKRAGLVLVNVCVWAWWSNPAPAASLEWTRQFGTPFYDASFGVAADSVGNVYVAGATGGSLAGANAGGPGSDDAFLYKYNQFGAVVWSRQLGTSMGDSGYAVATDAMGQVYITGATSKDLGGPSAGGADAFIAKYDASGNVLWTKQIGSSGGDAGWGIATDGFGNVFISGSTSGSLDGPNAGNYDGFVSKFNASGTQQWTRQFGSTKEDLVNSISADALGNVYISGLTKGALIGASLGESDAFVKKYDSQGNAQWTKQFGTVRSDNSLGVSVDGQGNVYVTGYNSGDFNVPNPDFANAFLNKLDTDGNAVWARSLGSAALDSAYSVSVDDQGNAFIAGRTAGNLGGVNAGLDDIFVSKYDAAGDLKWTQQWGTAANDIAYSISADGGGNVYVSGSTFGGLNGVNQGFEDAFVARVVDPTHLPADFNHDGVVDAADLTQWRGDFGINGDSDANIDGKTDGADFLAWQRGYELGSGSGAFTVPEPAGHSILIAIVLAMPRRLRRMHARNKIASMKEARLTTLLGFGSDCHVHDSLIKPLCPTNLNDA
jgi:hypothetical protein